MSFKFDPTLAVHDLIQDLKWSPALRAEFKANEAAVFDRYALRPEERAALERRDFHALYTMGLHAYLGGQLARLFYGNEASSVPGTGAKLAVDELVKSLTQAGPPLS
jgi:protocatechuate 4,5-dioxygenase alpha chain